MFPTRLRTDTALWAAVALAFGLASSATAAPSPAPMPAATWTDSGGHLNGRFAVGNTTLHYIDFGGHGPALVMLAGLGNTAHVFDGFAPRFADSFHVYALTRRGYGESGRPGSGYDTARLAADVRDMLDSLGIGRAVLVGHSVAGDELSEFGARYPERTAALVYLDAAYDRSHTTRRLIGMMVMGNVPPAPPDPSARDRASLAASADYVERIYGVRWPASEVAATRRFDARGRWTGSAGSSQANLKVMTGELPPRYGELRSPVLALYATERGVDRDFPWIRHMIMGRGFAQLDAMRAEAAEVEWEKGERRRLGAALPQARIVELPGASHYLFLWDADRIEKEIRSFLGGIAPE